MASGLRHATYPRCSHSLSLRLRDSYPLTSLHTATRRLILQKARHHRLRGCDILSVYGFRFYFTPLAGVLFAFPSRYLSAIGSCGVFSLGSWSTRIQAGFHVPRPTQVPHQRVLNISHTRLSRSSAGLPRPFRYVPVFSQLPGSSPCGPSTPFKWFGLLPFRSPLLWESLLISFPELLRWFTSLGVTPAPYFIQASRCLQMQAGYPIRTSMAQRICAPPHGLSRLVASFLVLRLHRHPP